MGSVAAKILQKAGIPVLLIKPDKVDANLLPKEVIAEPVVFNPGVNGTKIVVTLDGSPEAESILLSAVEMAKKINAEVCLLKVVVPSIPVEYAELSLGYRYDPDRDTAQMIKEANLYLARVADEHSKSGVVFSKEVRVGDPPREILNYVEGVKPAIIAMATHARSAVGQIIMGSIAEEILNKSHLPILMVHTAPKTAKVEKGKEVVTA
jgi:nucleotide-binding universal stress UspA family protein